MPRSLRCCGRYVSRTASRIFYNYQYELNERLRDRQLENILGEVVCEGFDDSVMLALAAS